MVRGNAAAYCSTASNVHGPRVLRAPLSAWGTSVHVCTLSYLLSLFSVQGWGTLCSSLSCSHTAVQCPTCRQHHWGVGRWEGNVCFVPGNVSMFSHHICLWIWCSQQHRCSINIRKFRYGQELTAWLVTQKGTLFKHDTTRGTAVAVAAAACPQFDSENFSKYDQC